MKKKISEGFLEKLTKKNNTFASELLNASFLRKNFAYEFLYDNFYKKNISH